MQSHNIVQNDVLSIGQVVRADAPDVVGRRRGSGSQRKRGLSTAHISPLKSHTPIRLRSSEAKTGEHAERFVYDQSGAGAYSGYVMAPTPADEARATYTAHFDGQVEIWDGGSLVCAKRPPRRKIDVIGSNRGGGLRGRVQGFSKGSRRRLMLTMGKVKNSLIPLFVTLTYPLEFPHESSTWKRHLDNFFKRLARRWPLASAIWKLEPQKRLAPHFHMFVWGVDRAELIAWVSRAWYEIVNSGDEKHLLAGTQVKPVESWRGVRSYTAKYMGKVQEPDSEMWDYPGRWWGIFNAAHLPFAECVTVALPRSESIILLRTMRRYAKLKSRDYSSLTVLCNNASFWLARLDDILRC